MAGKNNATIDINLVTSVQEDVNKLHKHAEKLKSNIAPEKQAGLEKQFIELNRLLNKGEKLTKADLRSVNALLKDIGDFLFNVASKTVKWSKPLMEANKQFNELTAKLEGLKDARKGFKLSKKKDNSFGLTVDEGDRLTKELNISNAKGKQIRTYETLRKEANSGNQAAQAGVAQIQATEKQQIEEYNKLQKEIAETSTELDKLNQHIRELAKTEGKDTKTSIDIAQITGHGRSTIDTLADSQNDNMSAPTIGDIDALNTELKKQETSLGRAFKAFTFYNIALKTAKKALREAVQTVIQLDRSLTEQAMVTGKTRKQTYELLSSYQALAKATGSTTKDVAEVATQFMRQGKTAQDALKLTEAAVSAAKVAGISATESVNYLTTALNGFRLSADQAMKVSDKFASIAAISATSYEELATALSKVAAQANLAGMSIDYTTALLAKGIETTREAPETIGTALKTIIARMRELGDYGKTLDDSMDINNVETQLAYVGIALRDANGELRSTEDVLNDLGAKWETLNSNQQAAVAKALAGTRQQSRLIAMMTDYERVLELQEVAAQSAGATSAQMATYMSGMDAALNKINVGWENLVESITNNEAIINLVNMAASALEFISEHIWLLVPAVIALAVHGARVLNQKIRETEIAQLQVKQSQEQLKQSAKQQVTDAKNLKINLEQLKTEKETTREIANQVLNSETATDAEKAQAQAQIKLLDVEIAGLETKIKQSEENIIIAEKYDSLVQAQTADVFDLQAQWQGLGSSISNVLLHAIPGLTQLITSIQAATAAKKADIPVTEAQGAAAKQSSTGNAANSAAVIPVVGWIIWAIIMGGSLIATIWGAINKFSKTIGGVGTKLDESSAKMYNLRKEMQAIDTATSTFDKLDNKLIKTNSDLEEMSQLMGEIGDKISDEDVGKNKDIGFGKGVSAKDYYESFAGDPAAQRAALDKINEINQQNLDKTHKEQLDLIRKNKDLLTSTTADGLKAQMAVLGLANESAYKYINAMKGELGLQGVSDLRQVTENLISKMSATDQYNLTENESEMESLVNKLKSTQIKIDGANLQAATILNSADSTLTQQMQAYSAILNTLDGTQRKAFETYYTQFNGLFELAEGNQKVIDYIDNSAFTIDKLNDFYAKQEKLKKVGLDYNDEQWHSMFIDEIMPALAETNGDIAAVINSVFSTQLAELGDDLKAYNALVDAFGDLIEVGVLNMGQNLESLYNSINNIYSKASEWSSMSETDRTQFILDHSDLFSGESGAELLAAFESGNYNLIEKALQSNENLQKTVSRRIAEIEQELLIEEARRGDARNEAYIKYLQNQKKQLEDQTNLFRADLKLLVDQQQAQLDIYKEYLQKQNEQLEDALNARKDAYQKYFDALAEMQEDADYEEQATRLATNAAKLASSTDAHSNAVRADLESQLEELEKEHLKELRERAQEAVLNNIDDEVEHMSEQLDKILENSELLYQLMQQQMTAGGNSFLSQLIEGKAATGELTSLEMENWIMSTLGPAFASVLSGINYDDLVGLGASATNYNTSLNINQAMQSLTEDQSALLGTTIINLLRSMGYMN